jgi:6-phosphofructokinase 1
MMTGMNFALRGNLLVAHGGGTTAVLNASLHGVIRESFRHLQVEGVYGARFGTDGLLAADFLDLRREPASTLEALPCTPGSVLGSSRRQIEQADYEAILDNFRKHNVRFFFFTGGNGTMLAAGELARLAAGRQWEMRVIGIPKTVENDLVRTDHTPGYGSAARYLAVSALELGRDSECMRFPVCIMETIGRNTGWLAAATTLAARTPEDGPQLVYLPEIPFRPDKFLSDVEAVYRRKGRAFVAVGEALKNERGEPLFSTALEHDGNGFDQPAPGNVSDHLARLVGQELKLRVRNDKPGLCARMSGAHASPVDRDEAQQCGELAVRHSMLGITAMMVTLERVSSSPYRCRFGLAPLAEIGGRERTMPREFINEDGNCPTQRFREYALPLLGPGMPEYARLSGL